MNPARPFDLPRPAPAKAATSRKGRAAAVAASALFHLGLLAAMFATASGELVSRSGGGGPQGPVFNVTLVGPTGAPQPQAQEAASGGLQPLFAKYRAATDGAPIAFSREVPSRDFAHMIDRFQRPDTAPQAPQLDAPREAPQARAPERPAPTPARTPTPGPAAAQPAPGETIGSASAGEFWGRIEPCWRNVSTSVDRPVTIEVTLNGMAALSRPPAVIRDNEARLDEPRLRSEARALQALAACLPRGDLRFARRVYRLEFSAFSP